MFVELPNTCDDCGAQVLARRRRYCDECRAHRFHEHGDVARRKAAEVHAQLRAERRDPAHGGHAAQIRGQKNAVHQAAVRAWRGERPDPAIFKREILPGLRRLLIADVVAATGLSEHYCSLIRLGKKVPHPPHWTALRELATADDPADSDTRRGDD